MQTYWMVWCMNHQSPTLKAVFFTCDQCVFANCQINASSPYMIDRSFLSNVVVYSMRIEVWWFKSVCLVQSDSLSLRLSEYLTTTECAILEHTSVQWEVQCSMRLWSGACFNFINPNWTTKTTLDLTIQSRRGYVPFDGAALKNPTFCSSALQYLQSRSVEQSHIGRWCVHVDLQASTIFLWLLVDWIDMGYATPILYTRCIGFKTIYKTTFVKIISSYIKIKELKYWVKTN